MACCVLLGPVVDLEEDLDQNCHLGPRRRAPAIVDRGHVRHRAVSQVLLQQTRNKQSCKATLRADLAGHLNREIQGSGRSALQQLLGQRRASQGWPRKTQYLTAEASQRQAIQQQPIAAQQWGMANSDGSWHCRKRENGDNSKANTPAPKTNKCK